MNSGSDIQNVCDISWQNGDLFRAEEQWGRRPDNLRCANKATRDILNFYVATVQIENCATVCKWRPLRSENHL